jgi:GNAT superfamily N-acetyltransferase
MMQTLAAHDSAPRDSLGPGELVARRACPADAPALATLFSEMQRHYGRPVSDATAAEAATLACSPPTHVFDPRVLVALAGGQIVGSLVINVTFPAFELTRSLYIRDLYVTKRLRGYGIGTALVKAGARLTLREGFSALEWTTETTNAAARGMYEACGARQLDRSYYRLFDDTLAAAAS